MKINLLPKEFPQFDESIYAGIGPRFGAFLLDFIIIIPFTIGIAFLEGMSHQMHMVAMALNFGLVLLFHVIFVKLYGATPGKHIVGVKIVKLDGTDVGWNEAVLRSFVDMSIAIFGLVITHLGIMAIPDADYQALSFMERGPVVQAFNPSLFQVQGILGIVWMLSEFVVLLTNKRRRALHDFIGETLVIKTKYQKQVREIVEKENEEA